MPSKRSTDPSLSNRLPPLTGLEAFLFAARLGTFTRAGEALGLSPSALSRRIQVLEKHVGEQLFVRGKLEARLTSAGAAYLSAAERALDVLRKGASDAHQAEQTRVAITGSRFFMEIFIAPHLAEFEVANPDLELVIDTNPIVTDLREQEFDVAIRYGMGVWPGTVVEPLVILSGSPCCSPTLAVTLPVPPKIEDLSRQILLHPSQEPASWERYFKAAGRPGLMGRENRFFDDGSLMYAAAAQGLGFVLAARDLLPPALSNGQLVFPFPDVATGDGFHFVFPPDRRDRPAVRRFCEWILSLELVRKLRAKQETYGR
jgi:LysR family transcriptional regulator, glycine cleavage system transcriptional activator